MKNMKFYYICFLIFSSLHLHSAVRTCQLLSTVNGTIQAYKKQGENFSFRCLSHPCTETAGGIYNFTKLNETTKELVPMYQGRVFRKAITDMNDAGIYCCIAHCANSTEPCCDHIAVLSEINFHMDDTAYIHQNYTASCTMTANPRMKLHIFTRGCDFQTETSQIDEYTTMATIMINNVTSNCTKITCLTNISEKHKVLELLPTPLKPTSMETSTTQPCNATEMEDGLPGYTEGRNLSSLPSAASSIYTNSVLTIITITIMLYTL